MHFNIFVNLQVYQGLSQFQGVKNPVLTIGTFDGVHIGHRKLIDRINEIAKEVDGESVMLTFSPHPRKIVSPFRSLELITLLDEKMALLEQAGLQHLIIHPFTEEFARMKPEKYIRDLLVNKINVHSIVVGYDHRYGKNREGDFKLIDDLSTTYDYKVEEISAKTIEDIQVSSTKIRQAIKDGEMKKAEKYLGHKFTFKGVVVSGKKRGRGIGYPTANLELSLDKIIPDSGVFAVSVSLNDQILTGMMNIGTNPTFENESQVKHVEINIFDFNEQIYDQELMVNIHAKLRDEIAFDSLDGLKDQLKKDEADARAILKNN